jgi:hypothetical protein
MLNVDRVWARQAYRYPGRKLAQFRLQVITSAYNLATGASAQNQAVAFGAGAIVIGVLAAAQLAAAAAAATQTTRPGLDMFSVSCIYQADNRSVIGTAEAIASAVFGQHGDQYPGMELYLPQNTALLYNFTNLTTSSILITLTHHALLPGAVG